MIRQGNGAASSFLHEFLCRRQKQLSVFEELGGRVLREVAVVIGVFPQGLTELKAFHQTVTEQPFLDIEGSYSNDQAVVTLLAVTMGIEQGPGRMKHRIIGLNRTPFVAETLEAVLGGMIIGFCLVKLLS
jgi:hypothetical protein